MKTKRKKIILFLLIVLGMTVTICLGMIAYIKSNLINYDDITFNCGKNNNAVYYEFISKANLDINLNSFVAKNQHDENGKVIASKIYIWVGGKENPSNKETRSYFKEILSSEKSTVEWVFIFNDKAITVCNGEYQK